MINFFHSHTTTDMMSAAGSSDWRGYVGIDQTFTPVVGANFAFVLIAVLQGDYRVGGPPQMNGVSMTQVGLYAGNSTVEMWYTDQINQGSNSIVVASDRPLACIVLPYVVRGQANLLNFYKNGSTQGSTTVGATSSLQIPHNTSVLTLHVASIRAGSGNLFYLDCSDELIGEPYNQGGAFSAAFQRANFVNAKDSVKAMTFQYQNTVIWSSLMASFYV